MKTLSKYSPEYVRRTEQARDEFLTRMKEHGKPLVYTEEQYRIGPDAFDEPVDTWMTEIFNVALEDGYELSYNQMANAFFAANDLMRERGKD